MNLGIGLVTFGDVFLVGGVTMRIASQFHMMMIMTGKLSGMERSHVRVTSGVSIQEGS